MAFALLIVGFVLLASAVKNTQGDLYTLISGDFTGSSNFIYWVISILLIGAIGYIPKLKGLSDAFLGLVILVLFLSRGDPTKATGGFFQKFTQQIASTQATTAAPASMTAGIPAIPTGLNFIPGVSQ